jgi:hypothetical protein
MVWSSLNLTVIQTIILSTTILTMISVQLSLIAIRPILSGVQVQAAIKLIFNRGRLTITTNPTKIDLTQKAESVSTALPPRPLCGEGMAMVTTSVMPVDFTTK